MAAAVDLYEGLPAAFVVPVLWNGDGFGRHCSTSFQSEG